MFWLFDIWLSLKSRDTILIPPSLPPLMYPNKLHFYKHNYSQYPILIASINSLLILQKGVQRMLSHRCILYLANYNETLRIILALWFWNDKKCKKCPKNCNSLERSSPWPQLPPLMWQIPLKIFNSLTEHLTENPKTNIWLCSKTKLGFDL